MAMTLQTSGVNMNSGNYAVVSVDLGESPRQEVWIEPMNSTADPILCAAIDRKTLMTIVLRVRGTSNANLEANIEAVRDEFWDQNNTITYASHTGMASRTIKTYPSPIAPPIGQGMNGYTVQAGRLVVPRWEFKLWRHPYVGGEPLVI